MKSFEEIRRDINRIEVLPKAVLSFSTRNRDTGEESGEKSVVLSFSITLWHLILWGLVAVCALRTLAALRRAFIRRDVRRKLLRQMEEEAADEKEEKEEKEEA